MEKLLEERWKQLCAEAAQEEDPVKLLELVREINHLLEEKDRLTKHPVA